MLDEFITFKRDEKLNGYHTLSFELPLSHTQIANVIKYNRLLFKDITLNKWYEFVICTIEKNEISVKVTCESSIYDTLYSFVDFVGFTSNLIMSGLTQILNAAVPASSWQIGTSDITGYYNLQATRKSLKTAIWEYLENTQGYIEERVEVTNGVITGRYIDIFARRGADRGKVIYDDREISEINVKIPSTDIFTAAYGFGKNENIDSDGVTEPLDFATIVWATPTNPVDKPNLQKWVGLGSYYLTAYGLNGQHRMTSYENSDQTDPAALLQETFDWLVANLADKTEYSIKAADLKALGYETEEIRIGDTIGVDIATLGIKIEADILRYQEDYLKPESNDFELANYSSSFVSTISDIKNTVQDLSNANQVLTSSYIAGVLAGWNNEINATAGYVYADPGTGIITYDALPASATKVVEIKGGSIRIANSKIAGEWDWKTVMTGDGIIADRVYTGTLTGLTIRTSADGTRLEMSSGSFKGYVSTVKRLELDTNSLTFWNSSGEISGIVKTSTDGTQLLIDANNDPDVHNGSILMKGGNVDIDAWTGHVEITAGSALGTNTVHIDPSTDGISLVAIDNGDIDMVTSGTGKVKVPGWLEPEGKVGFAEINIALSSTSVIVDTDIPIVDVGTYMFTIKGCPNAEGSEFYRAKIVAIVSVVVTYNGSMLVYKMLKTDLVNHQAFTALGLNAYMTDRTSYAATERDMTLTQHWIRLEITGFQAGTTLEERMIECNVIRLV